MSRAFSAFPRIPVPADLHESFTDASWGNDACAKGYVRLGEGDEAPAVWLWCDYADRDDREEPGYSRFAVILGTVEGPSHGASVELYEGEDEAEAVEAFNRAADGECCPECGGEWEYFSYEGGRDTGHKCRECGALRTDDNGPRNDLGALDHTPDGSYPDSEG
jgi:hypothetical protein